MLQPIAIMMRTFDRKPSIFCSAAGVRSSVSLRNWAATSAVRCVLNCRNWRVGASSLQTLAR